MSALSGLMSFNSRTKKKRPSGLNFLGFRFQLVASETASSAVTAPASTFATVSVVPITSVVMVGATFAAFIASLGAFPLQVARFVKFG